MQKEGLRTTKLKAQVASGDADGFNSHLFSIWGKISCMQKTMNHTLFSACYGSVLAGLDSPTPD
jgi:hypothetical protein